MATQPATTAPKKQSPNLWDQFTNLIGGAVNNAVSTGQKAANTVGAGVTGLTGITLAGIDKLRGDNQGYQNNLGATDSAVRNILTHGYGNQGGFLSYNQAQNKNNDMVGNFVQPVLSTAGEVAPYVLPYGTVTKAVAPVGEAVAGKVTTGLVGKVVGKAAQYGAEAGIIAPVAASTNALQQFGTTGQFDPTQAVKVGLQSGALTGAGSAASDFAHPIISKIASLPNEIRTNALKEATTSVAPQQVPVNALTSYEGAPDRARVDLYKQQIQSGQNVEPLIAMHDSQGNLGVADGQHRLQAYKELGVTSVPIKIANPQNVQAALQAGSVALPFGKKPESPKTDLPIIGPDLGKPKSRFADVTVPESNNVSTKLATSVKESAPTYDATTNKRQLAQSESVMKSQGVNDFTTNVKSQLDTQPGKINDQTVADSIVAAQALDVKGDTHSLQQATDIYDKLAEHLTKAGQTIQASSIIKRRTPQGLLFSAQRAVKKAGGEVTPEVQGQLRAAADKVGRASAGEKDMAIAEMQKLVQKNVPTGKLDNLIGVWKAGLLSGVKTQSGNFVSNATFGALKSASDPLAAGVDKAISLFTKKRTVGLTGKGIVSGTGEGITKGVSTLKTGIDQRSISASGKYDQHAEINFKNKVAQTVLGKPANFVFRGMSAADQPFYYAALKNSFYDQAKADGISKGLKGKALSDHMDTLAKTPTTQIMENAVKDANKAVLGYDTIASKAISGIHQAIDNMKGVSDQGKSIANGVVNILAPFTKVPSAFLSRTVDFTPLGIGKEVISQIFKKQFDQRALSKAIAEGATGTGLIAIGMTLSNSGQLSGDYPTDPKEQARWKAEGITQNSVKLGGKWVSMNYLGPVGLLFGIGNNMTKAAQNGANTVEQTAKGIAGLGSGLLNQSFVQGLTGFTDAIKDPARNLSSFMNSEAGSVVPSWLNDIANATDSLQRQASNPLEAAQARIPGLREGLTPKFDVFGNDLVQPSGSGVETAVNPLKPSNSIESSMLSELNRLKDVGQSVFPIADKTLGTGKDAVQLTAPQQRERQKLVGGLLTPLWNQIMESPQYQKMDDAHKANVLNTALTDVNAAVNRQLLSQLKPSALTSPAKGKVVDLLNGKISAQDYVNKVTSKSSPTDKYTADKAKYESNKTAGKLTPVQDFKAQSTLRKESITSQYSKDVQAFYGLSKAQQDAYFNTDRAGATKLYDQAKAMDAQLLSSGVIKTSKFTTAKAKRSTTKSGAKGRKSKMNYAKTVAYKPLALRNILNRSAGKTIKRKVIKA